MGSGGASSDEDQGVGANGTKTYAILKKSWRSPELEQLCRFLAAYHRFLNPNSHKRVRVPSENISTRPPPKYLPINWYSASWLASLAECERDELQMAEPLAIEIPARLKRYVYMDGRSDSKDDRWIRALFLPDWRLWWTMITTCNGESEAPEVTDPRQRGILFSKFCTFIAI